MRAYWQTLVAGANHRHRALEHRPPDRASLRAAAVELRSRGLTYRDIGEAFSLSESAVRDLLGQETTP